jgi:hypothetical protein
MPRKESTFFFYGIIYLGIGLIAFVQKYYDAAALFFLIGVGYMVYYLKKSIR